MTAAQLSLHKLPESWAWTRIGDIAETVTGTTPSKKDPNNYGDFIPFVKPPELDDSIIDSAYDNLSEKGAKLARILPPESVLVSCIGILGKTGINKMRVAFNQQINAVIFPNGIVPRFGFYYFQTLEAREWLNKISSATTVTIVNKSKFDTTPFPVAPTNEQHRIVSRVEELFTILDAGVESLKKVKAQLKRYRQAVLKYAFEGKLTEEWRKTQEHQMEPATRLLEQIRQELQQKWNLEKKGRYQQPLLSDIKSLPKLPPGWCWASVDELSIVVRGASPRPAGDPRLFGGNIPWITVGPLTADEQPYLRNVHETVTEAGRNVSRYVEPDTLLLTNSGATLGVPKITLVGGCINDGVVALLHADYPLKLYLYYFLKSQTRRLRYINQGAAQPNLNTGIVKAIQVPVPPSEEQEQIVSKIESLFTKANSAEMSVVRGIRISESLKQAVLAKAFRGELVPKDPIDEPADKLLERIREERTKSKGEKDTDKKKSNPKQLELSTYVK